LEHHNHDFVHVKLAEVYTSSRKYSEALSYFHTALRYVYPQSRTCPDNLLASLSPNCTAALQGLDRLEKLMRGVDPDLEEDADDGEGEVA
jgi:anaphase-promoting complex subunit 7